MMNIEIFSRVKLLLIRVVFLLCIPFSVNQLYASPYYEIVTKCTLSICTGGCYGPGSDQTFLECRTIKVYSSTQAPLYTYTTGDYGGWGSGAQGGHGNVSENQAGESDCEGGNPISIATGNKYQAESDFTGQGELPLELTRHYNSISTSTGIFGDRWSSNLTSNLVYTDLNDDPKVSIRHSNGKVMRFVQNDEGGWHHENGLPAVLIQDSDGKWVYTYKEINYLYNSAGKLISKTNENGHFQTYEYDANNHLVKVTRNDSDSFSIIYNNLGKVSRINDPNGQNYYYYYDNYNNLTKVKYPGGAIREYIYAGSNRLVGIKDERGVRFATWTYDSSGRANGSWHGDQQEKFTINSFINIGSGSYTNTTTNALGKVAKYTFDTIENELKITKIEGQAKGSCLAANQSYTYDSHGHMDQITDWQGNKVDYDYNAYGNWIKKTSAFGTSLEQTETREYWKEQSKKPSKVVTPLLDKHFEYDSMGRLTSYIIRNKATSHASTGSKEWAITYTEYPNGLVKTKVVDGPRTDVNDSTTYEYDTKGNLASITNALGHVTTYSNYDNSGRVGRITMPGGQIHEIDYNARGWITERSVTDGSSTRTTAYDYDAAGLLKKVSYADGSYYDFEYDDAQRLKKITNPNDRYQKYEFDAASNITSEEIGHTFNQLVYNYYCCDGDGEPIIVPTWTTVEETYSSSASEFDALSRLTMIIGGNNQTQQFAYRKDNLLDWEKDGLGQQTTYYYNALKQLTRSKDANGKSTYYYYNSEGELRQVKDPNGQRTYYDRDGYGQVWRLRSPDTGYTTFKYDAAGNVIEQTNANGIVTSYTYDALNRVTATNAGGISHTYQYDGNNTYSSGYKGYLRRVYHNAGDTIFYRNGFGELQRRRDNIDGVVHNSYWYYDNMGRIKETRYPDTRRVYYTFNNTGGIESVKTSLGSSGVIYDIAINAKYKPFGPIEEFTYGNGEQRLYERDMSYRLSGLGSGNYLANDYSFDPNNNVTGIDDLSSANQDRSFNYDNLQRLDSHTGPDGSYNYTFDDNGNRMTKVSNGVTTTNYYTSGSNKLYQSGAVDYITDAAGNTKQIGNRIFTYNGENRLSRVQDGSTVVDYKYNAFGERVLKQKGSVRTFYVYGQSGQLLYEKEGSDKKTYIYFNNEIVAYVLNNVIYYVHSDHLGRPQVMTNSAKTKVWQAENNAYDRIVTQGSSLGFNVGFPGQYWDADTNLFYNYFRDYDPSIGRYIQSDPIGLLGGLNTYSYTTSNPINFVDPYGLDTIDISANFKFPSFFGLAPSIEGTDGMKLRGVSIGFAFSYPGFSGGEYDLGMTFSTAIGESKGFGTGKLTGSLTCAKGSLKDQEGSGTELSFNDGVGGLALGFDDNGSPDAIGIHLGPGYEVALDAVFTKVYSVKDFF